MSEPLLGPTAPSFFVSGPLPSDRGLFSPLPALSHSHPLSDRGERRRRRDRKPFVSLAPYAGRAAGARGGYALRSPRATPAGAALWFC